MQECIEEAKRKGNANDKTGALAALRRKKLYEDENSKLAASIMTLESQSITLEGAKMQYMTLHALSTGAEAHRKIQQNIGVAKVENLMDKLEDQRETQDEIFDTLTQGVASTVEFEDELETLMAQDMGQKTTNQVASLDKILQDLAAPHGDAISEKPIAN
ncbi:Snf7 family [Babesia duncani]|uniref:Snf7 family n=1 Tax=Babesia duncani TaxID=323732 RepID=A0AAD9PLA8_9APIC|nr:Snf7 family [Babesia duncani]